MIYTNRFINLISFLITLIIFLIFNYLFFSIPKISENKIGEIISHLEFEQKKEKNVKEKTASMDQNDTQDLGNWYILIPSINVKAPIGNGTSIEVLNTKIGHFDETAIEYGNIGLAAHNRGYQYNFFENLKNLKQEDEITYVHENFRKTYIVEKNEIILNSDWSKLEKTEDNLITLITCVENEPRYRRCVQAVEK